MTTARFLQIHSLHSYSAALLNRDDSGLAKRLMYGGATRTRISSQCLKRHWRIADDPHALSHIAGAHDSFRSRELVTIKVIKPLEGIVSPAAITLIEDLFQTTVYGEKGTTKKGRQTLLFGEPEINWLAAQAKELAAQIDETVAAVPAEAEPTEAAAKKKFLAERLKKYQKAAEEPIKAWKDKYGANIKALREQTTLPAGLTAALFGRMVTSDTAANIDAPVHVAHAFTVHAEETESDYFTAVDDLKRDEDDSGADTIQETELTSGLYYGYVVVDVPALIKNCNGDQALAAEVVHNLIYLIAEVSPGAKVGSTAPYGRAEMVLVEAGDRQPRSLSAAFRNPTGANLSAAMAATKRHLQWMDDTYETGEKRRALSMWNEELPGTSRASIRGIAEWAKAAVATGAAT
jgi:CRISPR system Cascade subunit CasC